MYETNLERWFFYMSGCVSPNSFIRWGFYSLVASALERRVWNGVESNPLFPNIYVILVAPPGVGKGRTLTHVSKALRFHKAVKSAGGLMGTTAPKDPAMAQAFKDKEPTLIQVGADATTYEALVKEMSTSIRGDYYKVTREPNKKKLYIHSSMCFCLDEISSLFRKHTEDLVNFLLVAYDCGDYRYNTISRGSDDIRSCCLNVLAGTTPGFIKTVFGDELITDGFASRSFFIVESESRFRSITPSTLSTEQIEEHEKILQHVKNLTQLFGEVRFTLEALEYLKIWWEAEPKNRVNRSAKLQAYYSRKDIHVKKLAMVLHFCDNYTMDIELKYIIQAIAELEEVEVKMHGAVTLDNKNPLAMVTESIFAHLRVNGSQSKTSILMEFWGELPQQGESLDTIINFLTRSKKITTENGKYKVI